MINLILALITAFGISYFFTPLAIKLAHKLGAIDVPKDNRRVHKTPIPRLGGISIFLGFLSAYFYIGSFNSKILGMFLGSMLIVLLGVIDDIKEINPKAKLTGQILAALIAIFSGIRISWVTNPFGIESNLIALGVLSIPITIIWIVGITNTVNLIDGLDGLAAGVSAIASITLAFIAYVNNQEISAILLMGLTGAALGFLPYNFNPAKIFMGDTGSLFLGYILSVIAIDAVIKSATALAVIIPVLALGLPIFDTTFAIVRRLLNGKPIMQADKGHLHHRLLSKGLSQRQTVLILYCISSFLCISALILSRSDVFESILVLSLNIVFIYYGITKLDLLSLDDSSVKDSKVIK
ncbi:UDP-GlcNAc:undecaprenyl-phosphate GlcNAc-1-phosphate transferase [Alkalithermobacter thermoalcaliphilus JW-YL-7 = DSM 7308]|uniref:Glycosyl transferase family 4 n=1 Tax=Alkalithermobacter thermoalcaliphilus JW-YL-7 = DSM 7308 TaxID=1121328 RepID=A0A150FSF5_CLOPD|nr:glycosyl transferase family 4 [[Clostridium] paradoxum JW-YL-7 = DSM 7308]SHK71651.1 UDP-GlcNAc:undecaprenyl-phosphate GlcNAc-1-phosphate transferase [[Clostridium] paradoxum JW-YL-7 = DSM 7308]